MAAVLALAALLLLAAGLIALLVSELRRRRLGSLATPSRYEDTQRRPGEILRATSLPLTGKPDYLIEQDGALIPVELKSGRTPREPYRNHLAQLTAYCLLVEETSGVRPSHGIIKYPEREFVVPYIAANERWLRELVGEMVDYKTGSGELAVTESDPCLCRECRDETAGGAYIRRR